MGGSRRNRELIVALRTLPPGFYDPSKWPSPQDGCKGGLSMTALRATEGSAFLSNFGLSMLVLELCRINLRMQRCIVQLLHNERARDMQSVVVQQRQLLSCNPEMALKYSETRT